MSDLEGQSLGQYQLSKQIAKGGMATVFLARQKSMGRDVAVKILPRNFTHEDSFLERFTREVEIIANLQHPHILPVHDYGEFDGLPYIVMAYLSGGTLADVITRGKMSNSEVIRTVRQIADALDFAHSKGIIHRDFKPANVLLDERGNTYLADFGLAKIVETASEITGTSIIGTPTYMAPEQAGPDELTHSVDLYAFAVTIYQMMTGDVPYQSPTAAGVLMAHMTLPVPNVLDMRADLPPAMDTFFKRALAKEVDQRYASAGEMIHNFIQILEGGDEKRDTSEIWHGTRTALMMTNMLGRVIFVDNQCLHLIKRKQHEARNIMGKSMHEVLGIKEAIAKQLIKDIGEFGTVDDILLEIKDSKGEVHQVICSAVATRDEDGKFVGADITLEVKDSGEALTEEISGVRPADTREEDFLEDYFKAQITALYKLMQQWGGNRVAYNMEEIINDTGERNVWSVKMQRGEITVQLTHTDVDIYRALLARAMSYAASMIGAKLVEKELHKVNKNTDPTVLAFVQKLGLDQVFSQILS